MAEKNKKQEQKVESKFPSEVVDLPSGGNIYGKDSPLYDGKIEIKYMTAKEEDILTSENLIKKGIVIKTLLNSLIATPGINVDDLLIGDKNAVMVAARILAYGPEYLVEITSPTSGEKVLHTFDLTQCPFKALPKDINYESNEFLVELLISKVQLKFKLLDGHDEIQIERDLDSYKRTGIKILPELTTRLRYSVIEIDGNSDKNYIAAFINNMLSKDSLHLRQEINRISPDIELSQEIELEDEVVKVDIPLTTDFFWPKA